jgi:hypothetical protein
MSAAAENAAGKQRGRPFVRGQSGNPAGKVRGTRNKVTVAVEGLMGKYGEQVVPPAWSNARSTATWAPPGSYWTA